jgi:hypothetical protein
VALSISLLFLVGAVACSVLDTPKWSFNGTRLMPSFLLARGQRVFELQGAGPLYSKYYGPLTYVTYLPATLFRAPNSAVLAGSTITVLLCFLSIGILHFGGGRWRQASFWPALLGCTAAGYLVCYLEPLRYSCVNIHADGPGLALGGIACAALRWRKGSSQWRGIVPSATMAVMAALCKQPLAMLAVGLLVYLYLVDGWKVAVGYLAAVVGVSLVLGSACIWAFGYKELYYNLIVIAARHPWRLSGLAVVVQPLRGFMRVMFPVLLIAVVGLAATIKLGDWQGQGLRWLQAHDWMVMFVAGLALLPSSIAGNAKVGGDINSLSFASFFFTVGVTCMLADLATRRFPRHVQQIAQGSLLALVLLLTIVELPVALPSRVRSLDSAEQNRVFEYVKNHTETFFPWFPLSHFLAEGRFYHSAFGIVDRVLAGDRVSPGYFQAYVPAHMSRIAFGKDGGRDVYGVDLLSFSGTARPCVQNDPDLPLWQVYKPSLGPCEILTATSSRRGTQ